jgi:Asp-tRNA(Asn)/Glu-tRNA(Gln) amidotransferase A subunit family amidase
MRLRDAGAINAGMTNMHELGLGTFSKNGQFGVVYNPYDKSRTAGGSSSGAAGCVATGISPIGLGTDTVASNRVPASSCGVVGYKPTINRWPADYGIKCSHILDSWGPIALNMDDIVIIDEIVTGERHRVIPNPADITIGLPTDFWEDLAPEVKEVALKSVELLK